MKNYYEKKIADKLARNYIILFDQCQMKLEKAVSC